MERNRVDSVTNGIPTFINFDGKKYLPMYCKYVGKTFTYKSEEFLVAQALNDCEILLVFKEDDKFVVERESKFAIFALDNEIQNSKQFKNYKLPNTVYKLEKDWCERQKFSTTDLEKLLPYMR